MTADFELDDPSCDEDLPPYEWRQRFLQGYARAMIHANSREYASPQDDGWPVDPSGWQDSHDETWALSAFTEPSRQMIQADCDAFMAGQWGLLEGLDADQAGEDFALTRNGHGGGFWDRGLGDKGRALTEAAHVYGESAAWMKADEHELRLFDEPAILEHDGRVREPEMEAG